MQLEVEQKHRIDDAAALESLLNGLGVVLGPPMEQSDQYFTHPSRDFAATDEALRIRTLASGSFVTYKGPRLDSTTKTRRELELPLASTDASGSQFAQLLNALGFTPLAIVHKQRRHFHMERDGWEIEGALDDVEGVGHFVELELIVDDSRLDEARAAIASLAAKLGLSGSERRSYLEMLLANRSS